MLDIDDDPHQQPQGRNLSTIGRQQGTILDDDIPMLDIDYENQGTVKLHLKCIFKVLTKLWGTALQIIMAIVILSQYLFSFNS